MAVAAVSEYQFVPKDVEANFHGLRVVYVGWDKHLMFASPFMFPLSPAMIFGDLPGTALASAYSAHPDFAKIDWNKVEWLRNGKPWQPDFAKSLEENGVRHKDLLRFRTPGLTGIGGRDI